MAFLKRERVWRLVLTAVILLSGVAMAPFVEVPAAPINWERLAGVYTPDLDVNATTGAPGSVFAFTGSDYPANSTATVYVNGVAFGTVAVDGSGTGTFLLDSAGASPDVYNVTMEVNVNASATQSIDLVAGGTIVTPPPGFTGPVFDLGYQLYLPFIAQGS